MVDLVKLLSHRKGADSTYRPPAGTRCLLSGPHADDDSGYVFGETTILWCDDTFVLYGNQGFWPVLNKWEHVIAKPLPSAPVMAPAPEATPCEDCPPVGFTPNLG